MLYRSFFVNGQPVSGPLLVLYRATEGHIFIPLFPIGRQALGKPVDPLGDHKEMEVTTLFDHISGFLSPGIGIFHQEVGGETGIYQRTGSYLPLSFTVFPDRIIEVLRLLYPGTIFSVLTIGTVDVTVLTTDTQLVASVPEIPYCSHCYWFRIQK